MLIIGHNSNGCMGMMLDAVHSYILEIGCSAERHVGRVLSVQPNSRPLGK